MELLLLIDSRYTDDTLRSSSSFMYNCNFATFPIVTFTLLGVMSDDPDVAITFSRVSSLTTKRVSYLNTEMYESYSVS